MQCRYYTAVAAEVLFQSGRVFGVEIEADLAERANRNLSAYTNVTVACGDGSHLAGDSYDAILVNAGATEIQEGWIDQLRPGGRLLVPLTTPIPGMDVGIGHMLLVTRHSRGFGAGFVSHVGIFHCAGARTEEGEEVLKQSYAEEEKIRSAACEGKSIVQMRSAGSIVPDSVSHV